MPKGIYNREDKDWVIASQNEGRKKAELEKEFLALEERKKIRIENDRLHRKSEIDYLRNQVAELQIQLRNREDELSWFHWIKKAVPHWTFPKTIYRDQTICGK